MKEIPFRINKEFDSFLRLIYIFLNVVAYFLSIKYISKDLKILNFWLKGALVAAIYSWYIFLSSGLNLPYIKLPGMEVNPQTLYGFVRSGTFKEGNFFGLFLILSAAIAFYLNKIKYGWFFVITVITTLSTISILSVFVLLAYINKNRILNKKMINLYMN